MIRVALVHDWLTGMRGGEAVLEAIAEIFPKSELFTLIYIPGRISPSISILKKHTSFLQKFPAIETKYRHYLPLMPKAIESFDLSSFDLVISSSHCVAKGIRKRPDAVHISYIHAPMRYMWDRFEDYFGKGKASFTTRLAARALRPYLQNWDRSVSTEDRVDTLIANSHFIGKKIENAYGRSSKVIYPFAKLDRFNHQRQPGRSYLMVGAFAPYKRIDIAVEAFNRLKLPLLIVGKGQDERKLRRLAGSTVDFLGALSNSAVADLYSKCRAFIFPGVEDFGITPLEAMASGAPVIAYGEGGASETITAETGLLFRPQTVEALMEAVLKVEEKKIEFSEAACRSRAMEFSKERFQKEFKQILREAWAQKGKNHNELEALLSSD